MASIYTRQHVIGLFKRCISIVLMTFTSFASFASDAVINVQGIGKIHTTPNAYSVTLVIEEQGATVSKLNQQVTAELNSIVNFLLSQGIAEQNIQSMQVRLNPRYNNTPKGRIQEGFVLTREIAFTSLDIENYDAVIDGALKRGVDRIQQFEFISVNDENAYQKALILAVKDAKHRAQLLSKELSVEIGEVVAISETGGNMPVPIMRAEAFASDTSVSLPGLKTTEARVNVTFKLVQ